MRIAFFSDNFYPELSGVSDMILLAGQELAKRGHEVDYFVPKYSKADYQIVGLEPGEIDLGSRVKIHRLPALPYHGPTKQSRIVLPKFWRGLGSGKKFDVIHSNQIFGAGLEAICLAKWGKIPLIGTNHNLIESFVHYSPINSRLVKRLMGQYVIWYFHHCNLASTPCQFLLDDMRDKSFKGEGLVVPNPIAQEFFVKDKPEHRGFNILYIGRLAPEKNIDSLIDAFASFAKERTDVQLTIIGQGSLRLKLEEKIKRNNWGGQIKIDGPFLGKNKQLLYNAFSSADVFAMPSTSEIQSMGTLQAMAGGLPIMAARAGGMPELVGDNRGLLHEPDNVQEIERCLAELYNNIDKRKQLGENAKQYAKQFSVAAIVDQWEKIYQTVIANFKNKKS